MGAGRGAHPPRPPRTQWCLVGPEPPDLPTVGSGPTPSPGWLEVSDETTRDGNQAAWEKAPPGTLGLGDPVTTLVRPTRQEPFSQLKPAQAASGGPESGKRSCGLLAAGIQGRAGQGGLTPVPASQLPRLPAPPPSPPSASVSPSLPPSFSLLLLLRHLKPKSTTWRPGPPRSRGQGARTWSISCAVRYPAPPCPPCSAPFAAWPKMCGAPGRTRVRLPLRP